MLVWDVFYASHDLQYDNFLIAFVIICEKILLEKSCTMVIRNESEFNNSNNDVKYGHDTNYPSCPYYKFLITACCGVIGI